MTKKQAQIIAKDFRFEKTVLIVTAIAAAFILVSQGL